MQTTHNYILHVHELYSLCCMDPAYKQKPGYYWRVSNLPVFTYLYSICRIQSLYGAVAMTSNSHGASERCATMSSWRCHVGNSLSPGGTVRVNCSCTGFEHWHLNQCTIPQDTLTHCMREREDRLVFLNVTTYVLETKLPFLTYFTSCACVPESV